MKEEKWNEDSCLISAVRRYHLKEQGYYRGFSEEEISLHSVGHRLAFQVCLTIFTLGLVLTNIPILVVAGLLAFFGVVLPWHPVDYLYNSVIRHWLDRPKLPPRSSQGKFACSIATVWIALVIFLFATSHFLAGYILGGIMFLIAFLVSTTDICIPSKIYNYLFLRKKIRIDEPSGNVFSSRNTPE
ncbi:DUF4395 family protein [Salinimicrobium soli]|uniref:DUF4395 family protein n=1 Tax=Salinimicrobium soli TaxID=1254399 RepID=UPI003AAAFCFD